MEDFREGIEFMRLNSNSELYWILALGYKVKVTCILIELVTKLTFPWILESKGPRPSGGYIFSFHNYEDEDGLLYHFVGWDLIFSMVRCK